MQGKCTICDVEGEFFIIVVINMSLAVISPLINMLLSLTTFGIITAREIKVSPSCYFTTFEIITGRARASCPPPSQPQVLGQ